MHGHNGKKYRGTKDVVFHLVSLYDRTRTSDEYLYYKVLEHYAEKNHIDLSKISIVDFLLNRPDEFPPFETVRRSRQAILEDMGG